MATTRHERRKAAQARLLAKSERIAKAHIGHVRDMANKVMKDNLSNPYRPVSKSPVRSNILSLGDKAPRFIGR